MEKTYKAINGEITLTEKGVNIQLDGKIRLVKYKEIKRTKLELATDETEGYFDVFTRNGNNYRFRLDISSNNWIDVKKDIIKGSERTIVIDATPNIDIIKTNKKSGNAKVNSLFLSAVFILLSILLSYFGYEAIFSSTDKMVSALSKGSYHNPVIDNLGAYFLFGLGGLFMVIGIVLFVNIFRNNNEMPKQSSIDKNTIDKRGVEDSRENEQNADYIDEIRKLSKLRDMGVITQEEFELKKKQLLGL